MDAFPKGFPTAVSCRGFPRYVGLVFGIQSSKCRLALEDYHETVCRVDSRSILSDNSLSATPNGTEPVESATRRGDWKAAPRLHPHQPETIIACGVFRHSLKHLNLVQRFPGVCLRFLPPNLHINPHLLERRVVQEIRRAKNRGNKVTCLYGDCFADIDACCAQYSASRAVGSHCYEIFLGTEVFQRLINESAGTYFLERELLKDFERLCAEPLELHDEEMRRALFKHYKKLVYVRQPSDKGLEAKARELAGFPGTCIGHSGYRLHASGKAVGGSDRVCIRLCG
jgi:hypothetical protein